MPTLKTGNGNRAIGGVSPALVSGELNHEGIKLSVDGLAELIM